MRYKFVSIIGVLCILVLLSSTAAVWAEKNLPPDRYSPDLHTGDELDSVQADLHRGRPEQMRGFQLNQAQSPDALGAPGTTFRFVRQFGVTETAYPSSTGLLNLPAGLGTDGSNLWIAESNGRRAIKFTGDGVYLAQIGKSGFRYSQDTTFEYLIDVGVDPFGNIWVVDGAEHVVKFNSAGDWLMELGETWEPGTNNAHFNYPYSVDFDTSGNVYIADEGNHRIQVFTNAGVYLATIGVTGTTGNGNNYLDTPAHIEVDSNNRLYVADYGNHRVQIFNVANPAAAVYLGTIGQTDTPGNGNYRFNYPEGVAADPARDRIFVADAENGRIQVFTYSSWTYVKSTYVDAYPVDVVVDNLGNLYVARMYTNVSDVVKYNTSQAPVRTFGVTGVPYMSDWTYFNRPSGVAVAPDGSIYIGEQAGNRLLKLNADGTHRWTIGVPGVRGGGNYQFRGIEDVDIDANGLVYAVDRGNHRVLVFSPTGIYAAMLGSGNYGSGNNDFASPYGIAFGPDGRIFVADRDNQRVQVFSAGFVYQATLGVTGVGGGDNAHFDGPRDVAVDAAGNIYVVDQYNHRIQVFNPNLTYQRTIGISGVDGWDFFHLAFPTAVTVDRLGRTYVGDQWGGRVTVFDSGGNFLTMLADAGGPRTGQVLSVEGLALDADGNLYIAERENHRVKKYAQGVPGWAQRNIGGFGTKENYFISALEPFNAMLYAGTMNWTGNGAQVWRSADGVNWAPVVTDGFGVSYNEGMTDFQVFNGKLFAGTATWDYELERTYDGQVWSSTNGSTWNRVVFPGFNPDYSEITTMTVYNGQIYATTWHSTNGQGAEIWRSDTGDSLDWERVVTNGFGNSHNIGIVGFEEYGGYLYASTYNSDQGAEVYRTNDGVMWAPAGTQGFGDPFNRYVSGLKSFNGYLYAGTFYYTGSSDPGAELWRCQVCTGADWEEVTSVKGFGDSNNRSIVSLSVYKEQLIATTINLETGVEVWASSDGVSWMQMNSDGFTDSNNDTLTWGENSITTFKDHLYMGLRNTRTGAPIWMLLDQKIFLPLALR